SRSGRPHLARRPRQRRAAGCTGSRGAAECPHRSRQPTPRLRARRARTVGRVLAGPNMRLVSAIGENTSGIPHAIRPALHVVTKQRVPSPDCAPVTGRLPPGVNAFIGGVEQILAWPALRTHLASQQAAWELCIDALKPRVPVVMALQRDPCLVSRMAFGLA